MGEGRQQNLSNLVFLKKAVGGGLIKFNETLQIRSLSKMFEHFTSSLKIHFSVL